MCSSTAQLFKPAPDELTVQVEVEEVPGIRHRSDSNQHVEFRRVSRLVCWRVAGSRDVGGEFPGVHGDVVSKVQGRTWLVP